MNKSITSIGASLSVAIIAAAILVTGDATAADVTAKGGATRLMEITTVGDVAAVQPGDVVIMACPKCKTVMETRVTASPKGAGQTENLAVHKCPGCSAGIETVGHGKAKTDKVTHVCSHCASTSAWCTVKTSRPAAAGSGQR